MYNGFLSPLVFSLVTGTPDGFEIFDFHPNVNFRDTFGPQLILKLSLQLKLLQVSTLAIVIRFR